MASIPVTLLFADGVACRIDAQPGQNLVQAAAEAGLTLLTDCANGQCGTCSAHCVSGGVSLGDHDTSVLPDEDRQDGAILCCVASIDGPALIELPYDADEASVAEAPAQVGTVRAITPVARDIVRLELNVEQALHFLPGQYVRLRPAGLDCWRSYSMANPSGQTQLVFYVRLVERGVFSSWLSAASAGASIEVSAPRGSFFLRDEARPRLFVAGGTGLAPFLAMLERLGDERRAGGGAAAGAREGAGPDAGVPPIRLLVGARSGEHLFARDRLAELQRRIPGLEVVYAAESDAPAGCYRGYATDLISAGLPGADTRGYLCGPPAMVDAARAAALKAGVGKGDLLCERFA